MSSLFQKLVVTSGCVAFSAFGWGFGSSEAWAQRDLKDIPLPNVEEELKSFKVADGFEVNLYAADPLLASPIQMNFDPQGRLWVATSEIYPHIIPGAKSNDKIIILDDTDGDGQADKTTVFADGLLIPTGVEPGDGGAYIGNSTELLHLRDTDGDGRADQERVMLSGFGTEDTHHILHTFRWGPDGRLYISQSIYIHSHLETPHGPKRLNGGGIWRFRPESMDLDILMRGLVNTWGTHFDPWGATFATDGAGGEGINYIVPGAAYVTAVGPKHILQGLNPGSPKFCGLEIVSGRHLPDDWQNNAITADFRAHRVARFKLSEDGSGYSSELLPDLISSTHKAFRPVDIKMGPDGAIYIADWYNPIIQHGEVDFRDPRRDQVHGRIWRITAKDRPLVERPQLVGASVNELLDALKLPENWTRQQAKRVLIERGAAEVLPVLATWVEQLGDDPAHDQQRLEAFWVYQGLDEVPQELLAQMQQSSNPQVRAAVARAIAIWRNKVPDAVTLLTPLATDEHARVRLEAVRALAEFPTLEAAAAALKAVDHPTDKFLDYALRQTALELQPQWLPALQAGEFDFGGSSQQLVFALQAASSPAIVGPLLQQMKDGKIKPQQVVNIYRLIGSLGTPEELEQTFDYLIQDDDTSIEVRSTYLTALAQASSARRTVPAGDLTRLRVGLTFEDPAVVAAVAQAVGLWRVEALRDDLLQLAAQDNLAENVREAAFQSLAALGGEASLAGLTQLAQSESSDFNTKASATAALATLDTSKAAGIAITLLASLPEDAEPARLIQAFLQRQGGAEALTQALSGQKLPVGVAEKAIELVRSSASEARSPLIEALTQAGEVTGQPRKRTAEEVEQLLVAIAEKGDPIRGEQIYRRASLQCLNCHAIGGAGGLVGPDLISLGASAPVDYILESLIEPNAKIKENYHSVIALTDEGQVFTGIKLRETEQHLYIRDVNDREISIPLDTIEAQRMGPSLMPDGLIDSLTDQELVDLTRFLSELGKGDFAVGVSRAVRQWQAVVPPADATGVPAFADLLAQRNELKYTPVFSLVSGDLPVADTGTWSTVRFAIDVSTPGAFVLRLNSAEGLQLAVDDQVVEAAEKVEIELTSGLHWVTVAVDSQTRELPLRVEFRNAPGSSGNAQLTSGK